MVQVISQAGLGDLLGQGIGQGFSTGVDIAIKQALEAKQGEALGKVLGFTPEEAREFKKISPAAQKAFVTAKFGTTKFSGDKIVADLVKKQYLDINSSPEDKAKGNVVLTKASEYLQKGRTPSEAYSAGVKYANAQDDITKELEAVTGPSTWGGKRSFNKDIARIKKVKNTGFVEDDKLAELLIHKGYEYKQLEKFGIKPSSELQKQLGIETGANQGLKKLTPKDISRFMEAADNDPDKAAELAKKEGYDIEAQ